MILIRPPSHVMKNRICKRRFITRVKKVGETYWNLWEMSMLEYEWSDKEL